MLQKCADAGSSGVGFELVGNVEGCQLGEVECLCQRAADAVDC
jgi:hypothetical protein